MVVNYRHITSNTVLDAYALPLINQFLNELTGSMFFTKCDSVGAYQQLHVLEGSNRQASIWNVWVIGSLQRSVKRLQ